MTEKELKKLSRLDLLQIIVDLNNENLELIKKIDELTNKLNNKDITITEAGSIAQAALQLNGVFTAAEEAAAQYLDNIKRLNDNKKEIEENTRKQAEDEAKKLISEAENKSASIIKLANDEADKIIQQANSYRDSVYNKILDLSKDNEELKEVIKMI